MRVPVKLSVAVPPAVVIFDDLPDMEVLAQSNQHPANATRASVCSNRGATLKAAYLSFSLFPAASRDRYETT